MNRIGETRFPRFRALICTTIVAAVLLMTMASAHAAPAWYTQLISYSTAGAGSTGGNEWPDISADGRYVVWVSSAQNLVNGGGGLVGGYYRRDVFWRDRLLGITKRVSVSSAGVSADDHSGDEWARGVAVSGDGRYVAFVSNATNLVAGDTNNTQDVFVHDTVSGVTERVSVTSAEEQASAMSFAPIAISDEGTHVAFMSIAANLGSSIQQIYLRNRVEGTTEIVSKDSAGNPGDSSSHQAWDISPDGRFVVFSTEAANITGSTDWYHRICVRDRLAGTTVMADVTTGNERLEAHGGSISDDGRFVVFHGGSPYHVWVRDLLDRTTVPVSKSTEGTLTTEDAVHAEISGDGRYVVFQTLDSNLVADDTNNHVDIFRHDRDTGVTERMNLGSTGSQSEYGAYRASVSRDGQAVAFLGMSPLVPEVTTSSDQVYVRAFGEPPAGDSTAPTTASDAKSSYDGSALIKLTATDSGGSGVAKTEYRLNSGSWVIGTTVVVGTPGAHVLEYRSTDGAGNVENPVKTVSFTVWSQSYLTLTKPSAAPTYAGSAKLTARLTEASGVTMPGRTVVFERLDGTKWVSIGTAATDGSGFASTYATGLKVKQTFRARFAESMPYRTCTSVSSIVLPKVKLTRSTSWTTLRVNRTYYARGYIAPKHAKSDSNKVRIRAYKKASNGKYYYKKSFTASYSYYSTNKTRYKAAVKLTSRGKWKLVARHYKDARNATTYGSADYVTVK